MPAQTQPIAPDPAADGAALEAWARRHPADAVRWLLQAPNGPERGIVAENVCLQLAQTNPAGAAGLAGDLGADGYVVDNIVEQWAQQDMPAAYAYVMRQPLSPDRDRLIARLALVEAASDPATAAQWVARQMSPGQTQDDAVVSVLHQWSQQDRDRALRWAAAFPDGDLRRRAWAEVTRPPSASE